MTQRERYQLRIEYNSNKEIVKGLLDNISEVKQRNHDIQNQILALKEELKLNKSFINQLLIEITDVKSRNRDIQKQLNPSYYRKKN